MPESKPERQSEDRPRVARVRALKSFDDWREGDQGTVLVTERFANLIVNGWLEEM